VRVRGVLVAAVGGMLSFAVAPASAADPGVFEGPVARAACDAGSRPETALQGEVTIEERDSRRSTAGYRCNLALVGQYPGEGASWQATYYKRCAYYDTKFGGGQEKQGVIVLDVSDPSHPKYTANLTSVAMLDPWESLSANQARGLLAGVAIDRYNSGVGGMSGVAFFDVYDISQDCTQPKLLSSAPVSGLNHEGEWAPDGKRYYGASIAPGTLSAIDTTDPASPQRIGTFFAAPSSHGLSVSDDGNRLYLAAISTADGGNGLQIIDVSDIQARKPAPQIRTVGTVTWDDGSTAQHTIPITIGGRPYVVFVDEGTNGGTRLIDISDETKPRVVSKLRLEIQMPQNEDRAGESGGYGKGGGQEGTFAYNSHYCGVPQRAEPGIVGCSNFESGTRIFDVRDPLHPRELAYFNVGGNETKPVPGSHRSGGTSAYTSARVGFVPERGEVWFTDQDKGFYVTRFTDGAWPFKPGVVEGPVGLPKRATCLTKSKVRFRLKKRLRRARTAVVYLNGKRVTRLRGKALRRRITVRLPRGHSIVRVVVKTRAGRLAQTKDYTRCAKR
jgi:hypothetical protein